MSDKSTYPREDTLWTADDVAHYLRTSRSWVYHHSQAGKLPCIKVGGLIRFEPAAIKAFVRGEVEPERRVIPFKNNK